MKPKNLESRLIDLERITSPKQAGVVVTLNGETPDAAIKRLGISAESRRHGLVFIPKKKEQQHAEP